MVFMNDWLSNMDEQSKITFDEEKITTLLKSVFIDEFRKWKENNRKVISGNLHWQSKKIENFIKDTAWNVSMYGVVSGPYFPLFGL